MKKTLFIIGALLCSATLFGQVSGVTGTSVNAEEGRVFANSISSTSYFNDYTAVCGHFTGILGAQYGQNVQPVASAGNEDVFIQMLYNDNSHNWTRVIGGEGEDRGIEVLKDEENVYIAGVFSETVDFDPLSGTHYKTSKGGTDVFLLCLDRLYGSFNWVKTFGGSEDDVVTAMDWFYENGVRSNLYLTGMFEGRADFLPGKLKVERQSNGSTDCYLNCFSPNGNWQWVRTWGGDLEDTSEDVFAEMPNGSNLVDVVVSGSFRSDVDFDPGTGVHIMSANTSGVAAYVMKLNDIGSFKWSKKIDYYSGIGSFLNARTVTMDKEGNVYHAGTFSDQVDFDPGPGTAIESATTAVMYSYLSKLDDLGNFLWVRPFSANIAECYPNDLDVAEGSANKVYLTGYLNGNTDFDPNVSGSGEMVGEGSFVVRHDLNGTFNWAKEVMDPSPSGAGHSIETHPNGCEVRISHCGYFSDNYILDLDPETTVFNVQDFFSPNDGFSGFTARWFDDACESKEPGNSSNATVDLHPNPSGQGIVKVAVTNGESILELQVLNANGSSVEFEQTVRGERGQIKLSDATPGVYYILVSTKSGTMTLKWVVI